MEGLASPEGFRFLISWRWTRSPTVSPSRGEPPEGFAIRRKKSALGRFSALEHFEGFGAHVRNQDVRNQDSASSDRVTDRGSQKQKLVDQAEQARDEARRTLWSISSDCQRRQVSFSGAT